MSGDDRRTAEDPKRLSPTKTSADASRKVRGTMRERALSFLNSDDTGEDVPMLVRMFTDAWDEGFETACALPCEHAPVRERDRDPVLEAPATNDVRVSVPVAQFVALRKVQEAVTRYVDIHRLADDHLGGSRGNAVLRALDALDTWESPSSGDEPRKWITPVGQRCAVHNTRPEPDEPCWACERAAEEASR